jgi:VanZ family protein
MAQQKFTKLLKQYWRTIAWFIIILFLSTIQVSKLPHTPLLRIPHFDKIIHFSLYFILTSLWLLDDYKARLKFNNSILFSIVLSSVAYGIIMEIVQKVIIQYRDGDFYDVLANTAGIILAFLLFRFYGFYRNILTTIL